MRNDDGFDNLTTEVLLRSLAIFLILSLTSSILFYALHDARWINWDSFHYLSILAEGYVHSPLWNSSNVEAPSNVGFFPGLPLLASVVRLFGVSNETALLVAGLLALFFLSYAFNKLYYEIVKDNLFKTASSWWLLLGWLLHPAFFYLVLPYTEALFLSLIFAGVYFYLKENFLLSLLAFLFLSITRFNGFIYPIFLVILLKSSLSPGKRLLWLTFSWSAVLALFYYWHLEFGRWDIYFYVQNANPYWGPKGRPMDILTGVFFKQIFDVLRNWNTMAASIKISFIYGFLFLFISASLWIKTAMTYIRNRSRQNSIYLLLTTYALISTAVPLLGNAPRNFEALSRYTVLSFAFLFLYFLCEPSLRKWIKIPTRTTPNWAFKTGVLTLSYVTYAALYFYSLYYMSTNFFLSRDIR